MSAAAVLAVLLQLPPCYAERNDPLRPAHLGILAEAIEAATPELPEQAALITILEFESAGCWSVASGRRRGGRGVGPWQIEGGSNRTPPFAGVTLEPLAHAATQALWLWRHSWQCGGSLTARFTAYAGVRCSTLWRGARARAHMLPQVQWALGHH